MSEELVKQPIVWVDSNRQLERLSEHWRECPLLALDTEFERSQTYYPIAGLIQINDGQSNYLIDPKAVDDWYPLVDIFDDPNILKVMHSCSEDLEVFHHTLGCTPSNMLDTQIAGALSGYGFSVGFANLVRAALDVDLPKGETRSDWLQRPLSKAQIYYAALDVEYLYLLAQQQMEILRGNDRLDWVREDSAQLTKNYYQNQDADRVYLRIKSAWKLNPRQLACLKALSRWRENKAQDRNLPRNRIIKEPALFAIAQQMPQQLSQLSHFEGFSERMIRANGQAILNIIAEVAQLPAGELPAQLPKPLSSEQRDALAVLKAKVAAIGEALNIPVEALVKKKDFEQLLYTDTAGRAELPEALGGWRQAVVGEPLMGILREMVNGDDH